MLIEIMSAVFCSMQIAQIVWLALQWMEHEQTLWIRSGSRYKSVRIYVSNYFSVSHPDKTSSNLPPHHHPSAAGNTRFAMPDQQQPNNGGQAPAQSNNNDVPAMPDQRQPNNGQAPTQPDTNDSLTRVEQMFETMSRQLADPFSAITSFSYTAGSPMAGYATRTFSLDPTSGFVVSDEDRFKKLWVPFLRSLPQHRRNHFVALMGSARDQASVPGTAQPPTSGEWTGPALARTHGGALNVTGNLENNPRDDPQAAQTRAITTAIGNDRARENGNLNVSKDKPREGEPHSREPSQVIGRNHTAGSSGAPQNQLRRRSEDRIQAARPAAFGPPLDQSEALASHQDMTDTDAAKAIVRARENSIPDDQNGEARHGEAGHREPVQMLESHDAPGSSGTPQQQSNGNPRDPGAAPRAEAFGLPLEQQQHMPAVNDGIINKLGETTDNDDDIVEDNGEIIPEGQYYDSDENNEGNNDDKKTSKVTGSRNASSSPEAPQDQPDRTAGERSEAARQATYQSGMEQLRLIEQRELEAASIEPGQVKHESHRQSVPSALSTPHDAAPPPQKQATKATSRKPTVRPNGTPRK
jgi:hypothetical protein